MLRGVISKLERQYPPDWVMVQKLAERLQHLFAFKPEELRELLFQQAPTELIIDLDQLARAAGIARWQPSDLPRLLAEIPPAALSIYGRGPNWLYAALALHAAPQPVFLFDPRLGWVQPPVVELGDQPSDALQWTTTLNSSFTWLEANPAQPHLDYDELQHMIAPTLDPQRGVILSGKLPLWLLVGLVLAYRQHPWLAVVQAQQYGNGIVVLSRDEQYRLGDVVRIG
ncbi:CRISPR-associated protein Csx3 [Chloroflexus sp.]|uniref:CRISPR-associated protein Csx3 n=1 Tax=Chloroflexus sp. TaxID=1904827 RepID=UPI002ACD5632|nr:CRISPR-associated protein Csx3 [Chloroflexus sp.]